MECKKWAEMYNQEEGIRERQDMHVNFLDVCVYQLLDENPPVFVTVEAKLEGDYVK